MTTASGGNKSSISGTLASIARTEGLRGLFKGNGASVLRIVPYSALHFGAYEQYREWLVRALRLDGSGESHPPEKNSEKTKKKTKARVPPWVDLLAGSGAGATAVLATYPLDLARTRLAYDMEGGVAEAEALAGGLADERRLVLADRETLAAEAPGREDALEDLAVLALA